MKIKRLSGIWFTALVFALGLLMFLQVPAEAAQVSLNYGKNLPSDVTLSASRLYEAMYGNTLSSVEKEALDALAEVSLTYSKIPDSVVDRQYNAEKKELTITVRSYEYVAQNGKTVLWIPESVSFNGGSKKTLQKGADGVYYCTFGGLTESQTFNLDVDFYCQVEIENTVVNHLRTLPYNTGKEIWDNQLGPYEAYQAYNDWVTAVKEYPAKKAAYDAYLQAKQIYDGKKSAYDAYVAAKAKYDADVIAYRENEVKKAAYAEAEEKYFAFEKIREKNAEFYDQYESYLREMNAINRALSILDSVYIHLSQDKDNVPVSWGYYLSIKGPTATSFLDTLQGKEDLTGISRELLDEARNASQTLKNLLIAYDQVRSASYSTSFEKTIAKYNFYRTNYTALCSSLKTFYKDMEAIYCTKGVPGLVDAKGKTKQMQIMIAQSYALYTALDDSATMDPNWKLISDSMDSILYPAHRLTDDNNASPAAVNVPSQEMVLDSSLMEPMEKPVKNFDENMQDPALRGEPISVANPGAAPAVVAMPEKPADTPPAHPDGPCPPMPVLTALETALARAYRNGTLTPKSLETAPKQAKIYQRVSCKRSFENKKTVTFYDFDGAVMAEISVHNGQSLGLYKNQFPSYVRAADERYLAYRFKGWVYFGTTNPTSFLDLNSIRVDRDLAITPYYETEKQYYDVIWSVPQKGLSKTQKLDYWQLQAARSPFGEADLKREPDGAISYEFIGWIRTQPEDNKVIFTADYKRVAEEFRVTWIVGDKTYYTFVLKGDRADDSAVSKELPLGDYQNNIFARWENDQGRSPSDPVNEDLTFVAVYFQQDPFAEVEREDGQNQVCHVEHTDSAVILKPDTSIVWFQSARDYLLTVNGNRQRSGSTEMVLEIAWDQFVVTLTNADLQALKELRCTGIRLIRENGASEGEAYYRVEFLKQAKRVVAYDRVLNMSIPVPHADGTMRELYVDADGVMVALDAKLYNDGRVRFEANADARIFCQTKYAVKASDPSENSQLSAIVPWASAGEIVDLNVKCGLGYEVVGAVLTYADGRVETITGNSFVMPAVPVDVELVVDRMAFDISFVVDGEVYKQVRLYFGDKLDLPEPPTKADDENYSYSFAGWSPQIWNSAVYADQRTPEFTAVFTAHEKSGTVAETYRGSFLLRVILIGVSGMLLAAGFVLCIVRRKKVGAFIRRVIRGFVPFVRKCGKGIKKAAVRVWNGIRRCFGKGKAE